MQRISSSNDDVEFEEAPPKPSPSRYLPLEKQLSRGEEVLVQVAKDPLGTKGARVTSHISLPGHYMVFMPGNKHIGISRRIESDDERKRLKEIAQSLGTEEGGFILRTACEGLSKREIQRDLGFLQKLWKTIQKKAESAPAPSLIHQDLDLIARAILDFFSADTEQVLIDSPKDHRRIVDFVRHFMPRFVRLEGKCWRRLKFTLDEADNERLARLGLSARELSAEPQRLHALQLADPAAKRFLPAEQVKHVQRRASEIKTRMAPDLPGGVTAQLRPYQLEGFHFLAYLAANRFGGILADDMGLGKTLQALDWLLWLRQPPPDNAAAPAPADGSAPPPSPTLVVCPKSVMDNWHAEAAKFTPELRVRCWPASELAQLPAELNTADLHVINYSQLRIIGEMILPTRWLAVL